MKFPRDLIELTRIEHIRVGGRGGREGSIAELLPAWTRVNHPLYDYEVAYEGTAIRLEVKKQRNLQWFDSGKYYRLANKDREVWIMFVMHDGRAVLKLLVARLGDFIDWLCANRPTDGWNEEVMKTAALFKRKYPTLQFKARAHIAAIADEAPRLFDVLWERRPA